jgi:hypothetical protein
LFLVLTWVTLFSYAFYPGDRINVYQLDCGFRFRQEIDQRFSLKAPQKVDKDYKRTKDDFYRMELDKLDDVHPLNRPHMRKAYFAYLQNTPGSKKAITECVRSLDGSQQHQKSGSAPRVS